ncbi:MAG: hypothetical protein Tsb0013_10050 [Phycisphaerales bacterium]
MASTYKTLDQVEARRPIDDVFTPGSATARHVISSSGSYYLTGPLTVSGVDTAIEVRAPNVTIDLNGYTVSSSTLFGQAQSGIIVAAGVPDAVVGGTLTVKNGVITGFASRGVGTFDADDSLILREVVFKENANGVSSLGDCDARGCLFIRNTGTGISTGRGSIVRDCRALENGGIGINVFGGYAEGCVASRNGLDGISVGGLDGGDDEWASVARHNVINNNGDFGVSGLNAMIEHNAIAGNGAGGIRTQTIQAGSFNADGVIAHNFLRGNGTLATEAAIVMLGSHYRIDSNTITRSPVGVGGTADDTVVTRNTFDETPTISLLGAGNVLGLLGTDYSTDRAWQNIEQ